VSLAVLVNLRFTLFTGCLAAMMHSIHRLLGCNDALYSQVSWLQWCTLFTGFLTAMRQEVTRAHKGWSLDTVILHNDVTKWLKDDINSSPSVCPSTCIICGVA